MHSQEPPANETSVAVFTSGMDSLILLIRLTGITVIFTHTLKFKKKANT